MNGVLDHPSNGCAVSAFGVVQATVEEIAALRKQPGAVPRKPIPASLLRHADEQTVVGLAALLRAIHDFDWQQRDFQDWAVLGAPRYLGRITMAVGIAQYPETGPRGVSPLIIPNCSLHALAATISLALGIHGPAFGVGGGPGSAAEGLLAAFTVQQEQRCPGVWLVLTGWEPELLLDKSGRSAAPAVCHGIALALTSPEAASARWHLRRTTATSGAKPVLSDLARFLNGQAPSPSPSPWLTAVGGDAGLSLAAA